MKAVCVIAAISVMLVGTPSAFGGTPAPRHIEVRYIAPLSVHNQEYQDATIQYVAYGSASAQPLRAEKNVVISVHDATGLTVPFRAMQELTAEKVGNYDLGEFCGHSAALKLRPGDPVIVYLEVGTCGGLPASATTGSVDFAFQR